MLPRESRTTLVEPDGPAVSHTAIHMDCRNRAAQHMPGHPHHAGSQDDAEMDAGAGTELPLGVEGCAAGAGFHDAHMAGGPDRRIRDVKVAGGAPHVTSAIRQRGSHAPAPGSYRRALVRPVAPSTRTAY